MRPILVLLSLALGCLLVPNLPVSAAPQQAPEANGTTNQEKLDPPTEEQRLEVLGLLTEIYRSEYVAAKTAELRSTLASKVLATAKQTKNPVECYAMLRLAADIAVQAGDAMIVTEAIDAMDARYKIEVDALRLSALKETVKRITVRTEPDALEAVIQFVESAIDANDFAPAVELLSESARFFREPDSRREIDRLASRAGELLSQFDSVSKHLETLSEKPDDPEANLAVGKFRCFGRNEWAEGLKNLAKGSDPRLKLLASWELKGNQETAEDLKIADGWWAYGDTLEGEEAIQSKLRAGAFYARAAKSLQGLQQAKATARSREAKLLGALPSLEVIADAEPQAMPVEANDDQPVGERKVAFEFPAGYSDVAVGGSGRYLIFRLDQLKKLAFFDVFERKVTQYINIETSDIRFTAGAKEFFIAKRPENVVERWSLETFKRLSVGKLPLENPIQAIVMGSASNGPLYVGAQHSPGIFLTPRSLRPIPINVVDHQYQRAGELQGAGPESRVRASANGRAFAMWRTNVSPGGFRTYVIADRLVHTYYDHDTMGYIEPSPDGELMYTSRGVYTNQTREYLANKGNFATSFRIPAVTGNYAVGIPRDDDQKKKTNPVHILVSGQTEPILTLRDISIRTGEYGDFHGREVLTLARRVYLLPQADLLITLPDSNKSLIMHRVNLEEELQKSGVDYLYVASRPPPTVASGGTYRYQIEAKSKSGELSFELISGPKSLRVNNQGLVTWRAPRNSTEDQEVIVSIRDKSGQQRTHTFRVTVL